MTTTTHAELRLQLLLALCTGHVDVPEEITDPYDVADFLFAIADRLAAIADMTTAADAK